MMKVGRVVLGFFLCLLILACVGEVNATDYYVAVWGNDSNPGTLEQPWQHPSYAAQQAQAGDTIYLVDSRSDPTAIEAPINGTLTFTNNSTIVTGVGSNFTSELVPGNWIKSDNSTYGGEWYEIASIINDTYLELSMPFANETHSSTAKKNLVWIKECVSFANSGNATHPIVMKAYNGTPTLEGADSTEYAVYAKDKEYLKIMNLTIQNYTLTGIYLLTYGETKGIEILNNTIHDTGELGIWLRTIGDSSIAYFRYTIISQNTIHNVTKDVLDAAIYAYTIRDSIICHNFIYDIPYGNGIDWGGSNISIEKNTLKNIEEKVITSYKTYNSTIKGNYMENFARGIRLDYGCERNEILNNELINGSEDGIQIYPKNNDIVIRGNTLKNASLRRDGGNDTIIENNSIYNTHITLGGQPAENVTLNNLTFKGNFMKDCKYLEIRPATYNITIKNNIFTNFSGYPGAIFLGYTAGLRQNITIKNNVFYSIHTDAIDFSEEFGNIVDRVYIKNNIFMNISGFAVDNNIGTNVSVMYNDVWNNATLAFDGVIDYYTIYKDPLFADPPNDFHLKSQYGRWNGTDWVKDDINSPCIDAGDPADDYSNEPVPNGGRINLGAYGNTPEASKSGIIVTAPANKWTSIRMYPSYNLTFEQISANLTNHLALSYYNKSIGLWQSYWVGYDFNKNVVVSERESLFAYFTAETNLSCNIPSPKAKPLKAEDTTPLYLRSYENKKIEEIKSALESDGCIVVQICGWDKINQEWNCTDDFVVHPSEGFIVQTSNNCVWGEIV